jgi:hypothetical protein
VHPGHPDIKIPHYPGIMLAQHDSPQKTKSFQVEIKDKIQSEKIKGNQCACCGVYFFESMESIDGKGDSKLGSSRNEFDSN